MFAPLSPTSSRRLHKIHKNAENNPDTIHTSSNEHAESNHISTPTSRREGVLEPELLNDRDYQPGKKRRRRSRRNSDPSSDRPFQSSKQRRRRPPKMSRSRDASPAVESSESDVEILPDRFDEDGRPLDRHGNRFSGGAMGRGTGSGQSEMVERILRDAGDIVDGRKTWKDLLRGVVADATVESGSDSSRRRRR